MVKEVVFIGPGTGQDPVEPVDEAPPALGERLARITVRHAGHFIVAAVTDLVHEHPTGGVPLPDQKGADRIGNDPGGGIAEHGTQPSKPLDPQKVEKILMAERLEGFLAQCFNLPGKALVVDSVESNTLQLAGFLISVRIKKVSPDVTRLPHGAPL